MNLYIETHNQPELLKNLNNLEILYKNFGLIALSYKWLKDNGHMKLYNILAIKYKLKLEEISELWNIHREWKLQRSEMMTKSRGVQNWTDEFFDLKMKEVIQKYNFIPPCEFLRQNGYGNLCYAIYKKRLTWEILQTRYNVIKQSKYWSRNGLYWNSMAEACMANFLYSRGIIFKKGERYSLDYCEMFNAKYALFDIHFKSKDDEWIDVEIWGDKPNGHQEKEYAEKRKNKEQFNENNSNFLGLSYKDCYIESKLVSILEPYLENIEVATVFVNENDKKVKSVHWSQMDEVLEICKFIIGKNGYIPPEDWLRCRGKHKNRVINDWEKKYNLGSLSVYIKNVGGMRLVRTLLDDNETSTIKWSHELIVNEIKDIFKTYKKSPQKLLGELNIKKDKNVDDILLTKRMNRIIGACSNHFKNGYREACEKAGIPIRKKPVLIKI